jgi:hypothetical protein
MKTLKYNGEYWYTDERSLWKRVRQWVIWVGGWEKANGKGWQFTIDYGNRKGLMNPTPISLFGHAITFYGWGWQIHLWKMGYFVCTKSGMYISSDGTPPDNYPKTGFYIFRRAR